MTNVHSRFMHEFEFGLNSREKTTFINTNQVSFDEALQPNQTPDAGAIGRQAKRLKIAQRIVDFDDSPIEDADVGDRFSRAVEMSLERIVNSNNNQDGIVAAFGAAINAACQPGGAIHNMMIGACEPGGAIHNVMIGACQPGGAISNLFIIERSINDARYVNDQIASSSGSINGLVAPNGQVPPGFPGTLGEFWSLDVATCNQLLEDYGLPANGTLDAKKKRLAFFCRLKRPIN
jgi:hypothetical protein